MMLMTFKYKDEEGLDITYTVRDSLTVNEVLDNFANFMRAIGYQIGDLENITEE